MVMGQCVSTTLDSITQLTSLYSRSGSLHERMPIGIHMRARVSVFQVNLELDILGL